MKSRVSTKIILHVFLVLLTIIVLIPLVWMLINSFKTNKEMMTDSLSLPAQWQLSNYNNAWNKGLSGYFINSIFITALSVCFICLLAAMAAFGLSRFKFKGQNVLFFIILGGMMVSEYCAVVPLFKMLNAINLYNSQWGLIFIYTAFRLPFSIFLMRSYFMGLSKDIEEAAIIDGCGTMRIFWQITLPLSKPIVLSAAIISAIFVWNEFLFAMLFLENRNLMTMPIGLQVFRGQLKIDYVSSMAGIVICSLPLILVFIIFQKQFVRGLSAGGVKA